MSETKIPVPRGGIETDWHAACVLMHRRFRKLEKAAQAVVSETARIHDNEPWPIKYRAPYEAITKLSETLAEVGSAYPPAARRSGDEESGELCSDCPRVGHSTDETRCLPCPRRAAIRSTETPEGGEG